MAYKKYDQRDDPLFQNSCTIVTMLGIIADHWGLEFKKDVIINMLIYFEENGKRLRRYGAYFSIIYAAFVKYVKWKTGISLSIYTLNILHKEFERREKQLTFGLGIKKVGKAYKQAFEDNVMTKKELDEIKKFNKSTGHAIRRTKEGDIVSSFGLGIANISLGNLRYGVHIGLFYPTARTLIPDGVYSKYVSKYLRSLMNNPKYKGGEVKGSLKKYAYNTAYELHKKYGINRKK